MLFGLQEKKVIRQILRKVVEFSEVELLTYTIMSNHIHVLVRVSSRTKDISDLELLRRYKVLYPEPTPHQPSDLLKLSACSVGMKSMAKNFVNS